MSAAVYQHPDGHEITVGDGLLTACTSEGTAVSLPIGPDGLRDVAAKLLALWCAAPSRWFRKGGRK